MDETIQVHVEYMDAFGTCLGSMTIPMHLEEWEIVDKFYQRTVKFLPHLNGALPYWLRYSKIEPKARM